MYNWIFYEISHDGIACYAHFHNAGQERYAEGDIKRKKQIDIKIKENIVKIGYIQRIVLTIEK